MRSDLDTRVTHPFLRGAALHSGKIQAFGGATDFLFSIFTPNQRKTSAIDCHRSNQGHRKDIQLPCFLPSCCWKPNVKEDHLK